MTSYDTTTLESVPLEILHTDIESMDALDDETIQNLMDSALSGVGLPTPDAVKLGDEYFAYSEPEAIQAAVELDFPDMVCRVVAWNDPAIPPAVVDELKVLIN